MIVRLPIRIALYVGLGRVICVLGRQVRFKSKVSPFIEKIPLPPVGVFCRFLSDDVLLLSKFKISSRPELSTFVDVTVLKLTTFFDRGSLTPRKVDNLFLLKLPTFIDKKMPYYQRFYPIMVL